MANNKVTRSPLATASEITPTLLSAFNSYTASRLADLKASNAGYANDQPQAGVTHLLGKILQAATLIPATQARFKQGRGGQQPAFIVLARVAPPDLTAKPVPQALGNIASVLTEYSNTNLRQVAPHLVIGYDGAIVQMTDLGDTAVYLTNTYPQPKPLSTQRLKENVIDAIIDLTAQNEAGPSRYSSFVTSDPITGRSAYGFIQFDQKSGSFPQLMQKMNDAAPALFTKIFGAVAPKLVSSDVRTLDLAPYAAQFIAAGEETIFRQVQRDLAEDLYWPAAEQAASALGILTQRAYATCFDTSVQRGTGFLASAVSAILNNKSLRTDIAKLKQLAVYADTYKPDLVTLLSPAQIAATHSRRQRLVTSPGLSDTPLSLSDPPGRTDAQVSDQTSVIVLLEGRTGDAVTAAQVKATATVLRTLSDALAIPLSSSRVIGLDEVDPSSANPGDSFDYLSLFSAVASVPAQPATAWFKPEQAPTADDVAAASAKLIASLQVTRQTNNIQALALSQAYDRVKASARANTVATMSRAALTAAAQSQNFSGSRATAQDGAQLNTLAGQIQSVPGVDPSSVVGFQFNFTTGRWSDGKPCGKVA